MALGLLIAAVVVFAFGLASWYFSPDQVRLRELAGVDVTAIGDARDGDVVRITGVLRAARDRELLRAPLSGRRCAHFDVKVLERVSSGKRSDMVERFCETASQPFVIEDASGRRAYVRTDRFVCVITRDESQRSGTFQDATPEMEALLARHGHTSTGFLGFNKGFHYQEGVLEPGERVTVLGKARWEDDPDASSGPSATGGYRDQARPKRLVIEAGVEPVRASDVPSVTR